MALMSHPRVSEGLLQCRGLMNENWVLGDITSPAFSGTFKGACKGSFEGAFKCIFLLSS